jgi:predicted membrane protein
MTLIIILVLLLITAFILYKVLKLQNGTALQIALPIIFIAAVVIDFLLYTPLTKWIIRTFKLEDKIMYELSHKYASKKNRKLTRNTPEE